VDTHNVSFGAPHVNWESQPQILTGAAAGENPENGSFAPRSSPPTPRQDIAARHIEYLTGSADIECCFRLLQDDKETKATAPGRNLTGRLADLWPVIEANQACGYGAFVIVNEGGHCDRAITRVRALFVERAHANIVVIAEPGAGKTPAIDAMKAPLKAIEDTWQEEDQRRSGEYELATKIYAKREKAYLEKFTTSAPISGGAMMPDNGAPVAPPKPQRRRVILNDTTTEAAMEVLRDNPRGVLNVQDEMSGFLAGFDAYRNGTTGKDRAFWTQADNGGSYSVDRVGKRFHVTNLSVNTLGGIQPEKMRELAGDLAPDGYMQRAFAIMARNERAEEIDRAVNTEAEAAYGRLLERLLAMEPSIPARAITLSTEAHGHRKMVEQVAAAYARLPTTTAALRQHLAKWPGKFCRLLLTYHAIECVARGGKLAPEVSGATAERAMRFMLMFILPHALRFYDEFFRDVEVVGTDARWIAGYILAHKLDRITARDLKRVYTNLNGSDDRCKAAMRVLADCRWVGEPEQRRIGGGEGLYWAVNHRVHVLYAERAIAEKTQREATKAGIIAAKTVIRAAREALSVLSVRAREIENTSDDDDEKYNSVSCPRTDSTDSGDPFLNVQY